MSESFRQFVLDQLSQVAPRIRGKKMFGGLGIYSGDRFFALVAGDTLYLKVDDRSRAEFEELGSHPFKPFDDKPMTMSYYDVPLEVLERAERLKPFAEMALSAARDAASKPKRRKRGSKQG
jgi:TfoX/Sxy family transcriptional regulator of competence genes